jgi:hypothetical protein
MDQPPSFDSLLRHLEIRAREGSTLVLSYDKLRAIVQTLLDLVRVDEEWYKTTYPDVADGISRGTIASAKDHYVKFGYFEARLPHDFAFDEAWYLSAYPDVALGISGGTIASAREHYLKYGYREGRMPVPPARS